MRLLRGESLEGVSRDLGVTAAKLSQWREEFLRGAQAALRSRPKDDRTEEIKGLQAKIGELTMRNELLEEKIDHLETGRPWVHRKSSR
jgi:transposase